MLTRRRGDIHLDERAQITARTHHAAPGEGRRGQPHASHRCHPSRYRQGRCQRDRRRARVLRGRRPPTEQDAGRAQDRGQVGAEGGGRDRDEHHAPRNPG